MSAKIEYNNKTVALVEVGEVATLPVKDLKMATDIKVTAESEPIPDNYYNTSDANVDASMVLAGKRFYGKDGGDNGELPDYYTSGDYTHVLDASSTSVSLNGAYKGTVYIDIKNPAKITANGTYRASSETVMTEVVVDVQVPVWDGSNVIKAPL